MRLALVAIFIFLAATVHSLPLKYGDDVNVVDKNQEFNTDEENHEIQKREKSEAKGKYIQMEMLTHTYGFT